MSMINDALKRAQNAQQNIPSRTRPMAPMASVVPVTPIKPSRPAKAKREPRNFNWVFSGVVFLLIVVAVFFIALSAARQKVKTLFTAPAFVPAQQVETAATPETNPPAAATPEPEASVPDVIGPAAINTEAPKPTRIQGIAYDPVNPWAIISGRTVYIGDFVDGMRVTAISRNTITLVGNGQTNRLVVGQQ